VIRLRLVGGLFGIGGCRDRDDGGAVARGGAQMHPLVGRVRRPRYVLRPDGQLFGRALSGQCEFNRLGFKESAGGGNFCESLSQP